MALDPNRLIENLGQDIRSIGASFLMGQNNALQQQQARQALAINDFWLQQAQREEQRAQQFQTDLDAYYRDPTPESLARLAARYPEQAEGLKQTYQMMDQQQRQSRVLQYGSLMNAASNGRVDLVKRQVQQIRDAEAAKGIDTSEADDLLNRLNDGDTSALNQVKGFAQLHLAAIDPGKFPLQEQDHFTSTGDGAIYDKRTGEIVRQAPEKPEYRTIQTTDENGNPVTQVIRIGGSATEGGGPASGGTGGGAAAPRSVRNNNPGNLKASAFTRKLPGFQGVDSGGFAIFDTPQNGAAAQAALLGNYIDRGINTVGKIISRWAPPSDNNDTGAYVRFVAKQLGVNPSDTVTKAMIPRLQAAIAQFEGGPASPSNGAAQVSGGQSAGPEVLYQTAGRAKKGYRLLTPQEVAQIPGLDPSKAYQQSPDGAITAIGGGAGQGQLKPWPATALQSRSSNDAALKNIDGALSLLDPKNNSPEARAARGAIGFGTGALGNTLTNWNDPEGVDFRARIGQIGGIIIKDTSGAAVSLAEDQRLAKWVPLVTDSPAAARAKLGNLRRELKQRNQALDETYTEDQGYRPFRKSQPQQPAQGQFRILRVRPK